MCPEAAEYDDSLHTSFVYRKNEMKIKGAVYNTIYNTGLDPPEQ